VFAIDGGQILRKYHFYQGTYAIEVRHNNGLIARYGEVKNSTVAHAGVNDQVTRGQHIGYIDHLNMLHFELYSGNAEGPLTTRGGNSFQRRSDLLDPTPYLVRWEELTF